MMIRSEKAQDRQAIFALTTAAFAPKAYSDGSEAPIIDQLRADGDLTLSLVAEDDQEVIGHVAFSPVTIDGAHGGWFGLGPISVAPDRQGAGIGSALVHQGLGALRAMGAAGCALIGDPNYYRRFGFISDSHLSYGSLPLTHVQWLAFEGAEAKGALKFAPAFETSTA